MNDILSIIAPAHNEVENVGRLIEELEAAADRLPVETELIVVDDASTDGTLSRLEALASEHPRLRLLHLPARPGGRGHGQSAAFRAAIGAARGDIIAMLDADLQNDPADLPELLRVMRDQNADMVQGDRSHARKDSLVRKVSSLVGRGTRRLILGDIVRDTGCSLRILRRELALQLPLEFRGMHRFIPIIAKQLGYHVIEHPVNHRPRIAGTAKYGIWNRAIPGLIDCFAVRWMRARRVKVKAEQVQALETDAAAPSIHVTVKRPEGVEAAAGR